MTRVSTIVEILKIVSKIFSNKKTNKFHFFYTIFVFSKIVPKFLLKTSTISKKCSGHSKPNEEDDEEEDSDEGREKKKDRKAIL